MFERHENIRDLIVKHIRNEITPEENDQLQEWISESGDNGQLFEELASLPSLYQKLNDCDRFTDEKDIVWEKIDKGPEGRLSFLKSRRWLPYAAAAVVVLVAGYLIMSQRFTKQSTPEVEQPKITQHDIEPGKYKAMLTLDNGERIVLDSAAPGQLAKQGNTLVLNKGGQLVYDASKASTGKENEVAYNTLSTARGQTYATVLADGSRVWLNSASSIRYPVQFAGKERRVQITGEAYFEVKQSLTGSGEKQSFIVSDGKMEITVLGTHFNVNSYGDDGRMRVTLLEGSVRVQSGMGDQQSEVVIKPGQQAVLSAQDSKLTTNNSPNLEAVMAWKDGRFYFDGADINEVLQQLGRWYNLDVENATTVSGIRIGGIMSRNKNLSEVLKALELSDVHFRLEGKKLIVVP